MRARLRLPILSLLVVAGAFALGGCENDDELTDGGTLIIDDDRTTGATITVFYGIGSATPVSVTRKYEKPNEPESCRKGMKPFSSSSTEARPTLSTAPGEDAKPPSEPAKSPPPATTSVTFSAARVSTAAETASCSSFACEPSLKTSVVRNAPNDAPTRYFGGGDCSSCLPLHRCASPVGPTGGETPQALASRGSKVTHATSDTAIDVTSALMRPV